MQIRLWKPLLALLIVTLCSVLPPQSAPIAQEPLYRYGRFQMNGYMLQDPTRGFCGPQCSRPNPAINATYIHSPIFALPDRDQRVNMWETGKEFCRRARKHFGEAWWRQKGMPDCIDGNLLNFGTEAQAVETLQTLYARAKKENRPDYLFEVFQFDDFQPQKVTLAVLRFPGANPAPRQTANQAATPTTRFTPPPSTAVAGGAAAAIAAPSAPSIPAASLPGPSVQEQAELAARQKLNREQAAFAARQLADNKAAQDAFEKAKRDREDTIARQQAEHRAEVERLEREHEAKMAKWRADVAACEAGDRTRCASPTPPR